MTIAFYIHHTAIKAGGIFTYTVGILKLLINSEKVSKIYLVHSSNLNEYIYNNFHSDKIESIIIDRESKFTDIQLKISYFLFDTYFIYSHYFGSTKKLQFLKQFANFFNPYKKVDSLNADVFHVPMQYSPIYGIKTPVAVTMHDVQELHFPRFFDSGERMHRAINTKKAVEESDHTIVSFRHVKEDIISFYSLPDDKVTVCTPPISESWFGEIEATPFDKLREKYNIPENFLLLPAATWQHKNHLALLEAIKLLKEKGREFYLVSTGNKTEYYKVIQDFLTRNKMEKNAQFLGIVPEEDLIGLYKSTSLVVIPTLYEAGSGPLFEAMRYGAPAICSNVTSLPETVQDERFIFDPQHPSEIAELILRMTDDSIFKENNLANFRSRLEYYKSLDYFGFFEGVYRSLKRG